MGASATWLLLPFVSSDDSAFSAVLMVVCGVGALVPDLDAVESRIKQTKVLGVKRFMPISRAINSEFGHRGLLHSLWGWVGWTLPVLSL
jgi:membrane-bound metal-dependent hydrolase YbcI (DUF457 family)